ncbi:YgaP-like transmembrane domain [Geomicrobium halophilum]|uniref:YgaP-like transmembrane domain n=1 Tax=Geomicrobium halophilum TaxID=549000 RepID=UPI002483E36B|nr:YgaP-like transmembrane domain [Geomicrobium halophilum]
MNISRMNGIIRVACGCTLVACAAAKLSRKPMCFTGLLFAMCGGTKIGSGLLRYCPITARFSKKKYNR